MKSVAWTDSDSDVFCRLCDAADSETIRDFLRRHENAVIPGWEDLSGPILFGMTRVLEQGDIELNAVLMPMGVAKACRTLSRWNDSMILDSFTSPPDASRKKSRAKRAGKMAVIRSWVDCGLKLSGFPLPHGWYVQFFEEYGDDVEIVRYMHERAGMPFASDFVNAQWYETEGYGSSANDVWAVLLRGSCFETCDYLLQNGVRPDDGFVFAKRRGVWGTWSVAAFNYLIEQGITNFSLGTDLELEDYQQEVCKMPSASSELLLAALDAGVPVTSDFGVFASLDKVVIQRYLDAGAIEYRHEFSRLAEACEGELLDLFLDAGYDPDDITSQLIDDLHVLDRKKPLRVASALQDGSSADWRAVTLALIEFYVNPRMWESVRFSRRSHFRLSCRRKNLEHIAEPVGWEGLFSELLSRFEKPLDITVEIPMAARAVPTTLTEGTFKFRELTDKGCGSRYWTECDARVLAMLHDKGANFQAGTPSAVLLYCSPDTARFLFSLNDWTMDDVPVEKWPCLKSLVRGSCSPLVFSYVVDSGLLDEGDFAVKDYLDTPLARAILERREDSSLGTSCILDYFETLLALGEVGTAALLVRKSKVNDMVVRDLYHVFERCRKEGVPYDSVEMELERQAKAVGYERSNLQAVDALSPRELVALLSEEFFLGDFSHVSILRKTIPALRPIQTVALFELVCALGSPCDVDTFLSQDIGLEHVGSGWRIAERLGRDDVLAVLRRNGLKRNRKDIRADFPGDTKASFERRMKAYLLQDETLGMKEVDSKTRLLLIDGREIGIPA